MDNIRLVLILTTGFLAMLIWQTWQEDYAVSSPVTQVPVSISESGSNETGSPDIPSVAAIDQIDSAQTMANTPVITQTAPSARRIKVETDVLGLEIDTRGGSIVNVWLLKYPVSLEDETVKTNLLNTLSNDFFIAQTGLIATGAAAGQVTRAPTHEAIFTAEKAHYVMEQGEDELEVNLSWASADGIQVTKRYRFRRGAYDLAIDQIIKNGSGSDWRGREYRQLQRGEPEDEGNALMYTYTGSAIYSEEDKYQKYDFDELAEGELNRDVTGGWISMIQHYFLGAFVPPVDQAQHFYGKRLANGRYVIGSYSAARTVADGQTDQFSGQLYVGPKIQDDLAELAQGLDLTVDYGWLTMLAQPMYWVLSWIFGVVGNWGWTIIIFTILIKGVFFKLSETSYKSMANMRKLTPRIQALKDRYGDDKQRMQQAMMEIYKKEKINPLGGCLPMLVQMPFFIALYWVLLESVELRQAPWIFWLHDLSIRDPYFVLPLLMGVTMFIQQKLNPAPPDPMQAKMMMALPFVFTAMFSFFPSGLVLYWFMNNLLSIAQQWVITRRIEQGAKA